MKQLGNLALVCAKRPSLLLQIHGGTASVYVGRGHNVGIVSYGDPGDPADVCLECEDCGEVILDAELYTLSAREEN